MASNLKSFLSLLQESGIAASFAVTATVLKRHSKLIKEIAEEGIDIAVHGYNHTDYTELSSEKLSRHIEKATTVFEEYNIPVSGFRFPYLRYNHTAINALNDSPFLYNSSNPILWDVLERKDFPKRCQQNYQTMLDHYDYQLSDRYISLPRLKDNILEIPISLPDDDLLIDRLCIKDQNILYQIWRAMLNQTHSRGELSTISLHPERFRFYREALERLLQMAHQSTPKIWITSLKSIHDWWREKQGFRIEMTKQGFTEYKIHAHCSERASILIKSKDHQNGHFFKHYIIAGNNTFKINSPSRPVIGVSKESSPKLLNFLENEGFVFEIGSENDGYSLFLSGLESFSEEDELPLLHKIELTNSTLIRFWRWPDRCQSAFSISGDIDALTSIDFFYRLFGG